MVFKLVSEIRCVYVAISEMSHEEFDGGMDLFYSSKTLDPIFPKPLPIFQSNGNKSPEIFEELLNYTKQALLINNANRILEVNADLEWILYKRFQKMKKWESMNLKS